MVGERRIVNSQVCILEFILTIGPEYRKSNSLSLTFTYILGRKITEISKAIEKIKMETFYLGSGV